MSNSDSGSPPTDIASLVDRMASLAADEEWAALEACMLRARTSILELPVANRRAALLALKSTTDAIAADARSRHTAMTEKLSLMRRGRKASKAYTTR